MVVTGANEGEHLKNLGEVLTCLKTAGAMIKNEKCQIFIPSGVLGHFINEKRLHTTPSKLKAVTDAPTPRNVSELRSFLGLMNY